MLAAKAAVGLPTGVHGGIPGGISGTSLGLQDVAAQARLLLQQRQQQMPQPRPQLTPYQQALQQQQQQQAAALLRASAVTNGIGPLNPATAAALAQIPPGNLTPQQQQAVLQALAAHNAAAVPGNPALQGYPPAAGLAPNLRGLGGYSQIGAGAPGVHDMSRGLPGDRGWLNGSVYGGAGPGIGVGPGLGNRAGLRSGMPGMPAG